MCEDGKILGTIMDLTVLVFTHDYRKQGYNLRFNRNENSNSASSPQIKITSTMR